MLDILVIKMRSNVWMHFMPVSDDKAKRDICQSELSYKGGSTPNLSKRLKANHVSITEACGLPSKSQSIAVASKDPCTSDHQHQLMRKQPMQRRRCRWIKLLCALMLQLNLIP